MLLGAMTWRMVVVEDSKVGAQYIQVDLHYVHSISWCVVQLYFLH